eukprot:gene26534-34745_t
MSEEDNIIGGLFAVTETDDESSNDIVIKLDKYERLQMDKDSRLNLSSIQLALVSKHHSLWAEYVYNASRILADYIDNGSISVQGKKCLELGAGAGLPGLICALNGASLVVISDYGHDADLSLVYAIDINIQWVSTNYCQDNPEILSNNLYGVGYVWGNPVNILSNPATFYQNCSSMSLNTEDYVSYQASKLHARIEDSTAIASKDAQEGDNKNELFDVILMADLLFNRSEHSKLLWTIQQCLKKDGTCYITFSHHDPQKKNLDLNFFTLAAGPEFDFKVKYIGQERRPSYPLDGMDEDYYYYTLTYF